jgi:hypothetical protein
VLADIFALVAGTYYGYALLNDLADSLKSLPWYERFATVLAIAASFAAIITVTRRLITGRYFFEGLRPPMQTSSAAVEEVIEEDGQ